jgi:hypothetical protein
VHPGRSENYKKKMLTRRRNTQKRNNGNVREQHIKSMVVSWI